MRHVELQVDNRAGQSFTVAGREIRRLRWLMLGLVAAVVLGVFSFVGGILFERLAASDPYAPITVDESQFYLVGEAHTGQQATFHVYFCNEADHEVELTVTSSFIETTTAGGPNSVARPTVKFPFAPNSCIGGDKLTQATILPEVTPGTWYVTGTYYAADPEDSDHPQQISWRSQEFEVLP